MNGSGNNWKCKRKLKFITLINLYKYEIYNQFQLDEIYYEN